MKPDRLLLHAAPSAPKATLMPIARYSGIGATPEASLRLADGQWQTWAPRACTRARSSESSQTQWAITSRGPRAP